MNLLVILNFIVKVRKELNSFQCKPEARGAHILGWGGGFNRDFFVLFTNKWTNDWGRASKWQFTVVRFRLSLNVNSNDVFIKG